MRERPSRQGRQPRPPKRSPTGADLLPHRGRLTVDGRTAALSPDDVLRLQRAAGNAGVTETVKAAQRIVAQREGDEKPAPGQPPAMPRVNYVFIMGNESTDRFYQAAHRFFKSPASPVPKAEIVLGKRTLAAIIEHVNSAGKPVGRLLIVSHANQAGNLAFSVDAADLKRDRSSGDRKPRSTYAELTAANESGSFPAADVALIDAQTTVEIRGCEIGRSKRALAELDEAFGGATTVTAPTHAQQYSGRGTTWTESFARYYVEEPGTVAKSKGDLADAFRSKYDFVPSAAWPKLLKRAKRRVDSRGGGGYRWSGTAPVADDAKEVFKRMQVASRFKGWTPTYQGRTIEDGRYTYTVRLERVLPSGGTRWSEESITTPIPPSEDELLAKAKADSGRPDAFDWSVASTTKGNKLTINVKAVRTEWTIKATLTDASGVFQPGEGDDEYVASSD